RRRPWRKPRGRFPVKKLRCFFFSSRRRHTRSKRDWSSDVCSSDLTIGKAIAAVLGGRHEVLLASRQQAPLRVDIADPASIRSLYAKVGNVGAVISAAGQARFKPLDELSDPDFHFSIDNKLMGQVNLVRYGLGSVVDGGSITITSGILAQQPSRGSAAISLVNAGLEGFARAAALEA